jgi:hypothetical protein
MEFLLSPWGYYLSVAKRSRMRWGGAQRNPQTDTPVIYFLGFVLSLPIEIEFAM